MLCSGCNFLTPEFDNLQKHLKSEHFGFKYKCNECDFSHDLKHWTDNHMATIHKGIRFPCDQCEFLATKRGDVLKHAQKYHKEEKEKKQ